MKKAKITGDVAVMEIPQSTSVGVLTRARTRILQSNPDLSYLQLRSRRLQKPPFQSPSPKQLSCDKNPNSDNQISNSEFRAANSVTSVTSDASKKSHGCFRYLSVAESQDFHDLASLEPSFGENNLDFDSRERSTRESTPCSLIRDSENIKTPGSTTRPTCSTATNQRARNTQTIPTNQEIEEFFAEYEHSQQNHFLEKYNYDIKNDVPLSGRYEWIRVDT
ncbi:unnamed protein product [Amaranthus hypochondriacus]